jgi:hypothetical protein
MTHDLEARIATLDAEIKVARLVLRAIVGSLMKNGAFTREDLKGLPYLFNTPDLDDSASAYLAWLADLIREAEKATDAKEIMLILPSRSARESTLEQPRDPKRPRASNKSAKEE